jgi:hypothetical protein
MSDAAPPQRAAADRWRGAGSAVTPLSGAVRALQRAAAGTRSHALFLVLLTCGAALRTVVLLGYRPALIYYDTPHYLDDAATLVPSVARPLGYPLFLHLLPIGHDLTVVPLAQHLLGLVLAVLIYALLLRLGVRRTLAALAAAPVLLDAYQLNIEQYVLSETFFELLLLAACVLLLWRRRPTVPLAAGAGLLLAGVALTRASGATVIVPAVLAVALLARRPAPVVALVLAFAAPVAGYMAWFHSVHGSYAITSYGGRFLYARVAPFADCRGLSLPPAERGLCPPQPLGHRLQADDYMWTHSLSPVFKVKPPPGVTRNELAGRFARRVIVHQPLDYARAVTHDLLRGFAPTRTRHAGELPIFRWKFQVYFPVYRPWIYDLLRRYGTSAPQVRPRLTRFLQAYSRVGYVPNLLLGLGLIAALLAAAGLGRARASGLRVATLLFALMTLAVLLPPAAVNQFTWRYQIPQLILIPPAMALAATALVRRARAGAAPAAGDSAPHTG